MTRLIVNPIEAVDAVIGALEMDEKDVLIKELKARLKETADTLQWALDTDRGQGPEHSWWDEAERVIERANNLI